MVVDRIGSWAGFCSGSDLLKQYFVFIFLTVLANATPAFATASQLSILSSSETGFHFVYSFDTDPNQTFFSDNSVSPEDLTSTVQIAVPPGAEVRLLSASGLGETVSPSPADSAGDLASVSRPTLIRGRQTVGVRLQPCSGGMCYRKVEVQIAFEHTRPVAALSRANDPVFERIWEASVANYEVAKNWPVEDRPHAALSAVSAGDGLVTAVRWYKLTVRQTGLMRVTGAQLQAAGITLAGLKPDSIRVFNAGGLPNSINNSDPRPEFAEISLMILDGGDGNFGDSDQLIFYGESPHRWTYAAASAPRYVNNPYTNENVYWLAVSGDFSGPARRMAQIDGTPGQGNAPVVQQYWANVHVEQDNIISTEADGNIWNFYDWFWNDDASQTLGVPTPGALEADSAYVYVGARSGNNIVLTCNEVTAEKIDCHTFACQYVARNLRGGISETNQLSLQLKPLSSQVPPFLDYVEIYYRSTLQPFNNSLDFTVRDIDGPVDVQIVDQFISTPTIFDISDPLHPDVIVGFDRSSGTLAFRASVAIDSVNRFWCGLLGQASSPVKIEATDFTDLRTGFSQTDLIVVTAESLVSSLGEYVAYRASQGTTIQIVSVADVMDNFSYGLYDPTAIRDFLKFAYEYYPGPAPSGALFVGDANFDFLDHLGTGMPNYVPSYIRPTDRTYSDDNYVYFGSYGILDADRDRGFDMMTARWPVRSSSGINAIMDKILSYESPSSFGPWRTRITFVADDEHTRDRHNETFHTTQTETLEREYTPRLLNREKIYLWEYPFVNREKPAVNDAIVDAFNEGSLIVNYVGHGNPDVWAHEHVLQRAADLPRMHNADRLPLVYAASCDIGFFDDPESEGMAEDFLEMASGGAIAVISATRLVYAADNAQFNRAVYDVLFGNPDLSVCEALFAAKLLRQYPNPLDTVPRPVDNDRAYVYLGDPCLKLGLPRYRMEFFERPDSLVALQASRVNGRIVDQYGAPYYGNGTLNVSVYDSDRQRSYHLSDDTNAIRYAVAGPILFRGVATIRDGIFDFSFLTPLDVSYRGSSARVSAYAMLDYVDAIGVCDSIPVSERQSTSADADGPSIQCFSIKRGAIRNGDFLDSGDSLMVTISDPSGVNLAGGIGHGISLIVDDRTDNALSLTERFQYHLDSYTDGRLVYPLSVVGPGRHQFKIKAWDNVNNMAAVEFEVEIGSSENLALRDLLNYPNPMSEATTFYFELTRDVKELQVGVYTLSGKNIWSTSRYDLRADRYPNGETKIVWDGRDDEGDRVATGVYMFRVTVSAGSEAAEEFGKIVVLN